MINLEHEKLIENMTLHLAEGRNYNDLLELTGNTCCQNNKFIELNKRDMVCVSLDEMDYRFFWGCMKLFDAYELNYFNLYLKVIMGHYMHLDDIEKRMDYLGLSLHPCQADPSLNYDFSAYSKDLMELITIVKFFGLEHFDNDMIVQLESALEMAQDTYMDLHSKALQLKQQTQQLKKEKIIAEYFNFDGFSNEQFRTYVDNYTIMRSAQNDMRIAEALRLSQEKPNCTYLVMFCKAGTVRYIGKTTKLLSYIGLRHKDFNADSVVFGEIEEAYVNDVIIAANVYYDIPLYSAQVAVSRKYSTVKRACEAYKQSESLPKRIMMKVIQNGRLRVIDMSDGQEMIDKIELEKLIRGII
ncbi:MAG: hypothetical protein ACRDBO_04085 [Lachnospiraceae bacterium]